MKCTSCRHSVSADKKFCPECGSDLSEQKEKRRRSKRKLWIAALTLGLVGIAVFVFFSIGNSRFSPAGTVASFKEAVESEDAESLQGMLTTSDEALEIGPEEASALIAFLNEHPDKMDQLMEKLDSEAEAFEESGGNETGLPDDYYATLELVQDGKGWFIFDDYGIEVIPAYIDMFANDVEIDLTAGEYSGNMPSDSDEGKLFGPFLPGIYPVSATFDNTYVKKELEDEVELFMVRLEKVVHSFDLEVEEVTVTAPADDFRLLMDGQETDIVLSEGEQSVGLLPVDGSVELKISKPFPWGDLYSPDYVLQSNTHDFDADELISFTEEEMDGLLTQFNETLRLFQVGVSARDASIMDDGATANFRKSLEEVIEEVNTDYPDYKGTLIQTKYNVERTDHPEYNEELEAYTMRFWIHRTFHEPIDTLGWLFRDVDKDEYTRTGILTAVYDEDEEKWKIHDYKNDYYVIVTSEETVYKIEN